MRRLFLLIVLLSFAVNAQRIDQGIYVVEYDQDLESPTRVTYNYKDSWRCFKSGVSRKGMNFYKDKRVHTADNADYYKNVWDKGHMAPAASFKCSEEMLYRTFNYINSALQRDALNRGQWKNIEQYERRLATKCRGQVYVDIRIHFADTPKRVPAGAAIPTGFTKTITTCDDKLIFHFPNEKLEDKNALNYKIN